MNDAINRRSRTVQLERRAKSQLAVTKELTRSDCKRFHQLERDTAALRDDGAHDTYGQPPIRLPRIAAAVFAIVLRLKIIDPVNIG